MHKDLLYQYIYDEILIKSIDFCIYLGCICIPYEEHVNIAPLLVAGTVKQDLNVLVYIT